jgi:glycosyltransferase involved in cell wall biosynthesis
MKKICFVVTVEFVVKAFLLNHLRALSKFYEVTVIVNTDNPNFLAEQGVDVKVIPLEISREINLFSDMISLIKLLKIFISQRFSSVHSITPKAGLLAMLAAWIARVPVRVHTFQGEVWITKSGVIKHLLVFIDKLVNVLSTNLIIVSQSEKVFLEDQNIIDGKKCVVFCNGSISGVDVARFIPNHQARIDIRQELKIFPYETIFLFMGRLTKDKGVLDLAHAFSRIEIGKSHLLFVGPDEQNIVSEIQSITKSCSEYVHFLPQTDRPEFYMAAADILCLPSYREGFGSVVIEAAAVGIPTIASRIYGIVDAIAEGQTGLLHKPRDVNAIKDCMENLLNNEGFRFILGNHARTRVLEHFRSEALTQEWVNFYRVHVC